MGLVMICKQTSVLLSAHEKQTSVVGDERVILMRLPGQGSHFHSLQQKLELSIGDHEVYN